MLPQPAGDAAGRAANAGQDHEARSPALRRDAPLRLRLLEGSRTCSLALALALILSLSLSLLLTVELPHPWLRVVG